MSRTLSFGVETTPSSSSPLSLTTGAPVAQREIENVTEADEDAIPDDNPIDAQKPIRFSTEFLKEELGLTNSVKKDLDCPFADCNAKSIKLSDFRRHITAHVNNMKVEAKKKKKKYDGRLKCPIGNCKSPLMSTELSRHISNSHFHVQSVECPSCQKPIERPDFGFIKRHYEGYYESSLRRQKMDPTVQLHPRLDLAKLSVSFEAFKARKEQEKADKKELEKAKKKESRAAKSSRSTNNSKKRGAESDGDAMDKGEGPSKRTKH